LSRLKPLLQILNSAVGGSLGPTSRSYIVSRTTDVVLVDENN